MTNLLTTSGSWAQSRRSDRVPPRRAYGWLLQSELHPPDGADSAEVRLERDIPRASSSAPLSLEEHKDINLVFPALYRPLLELFCGLKFVGSEFDLTILELLDAGEIRHILHA